MSDVKPFIYNENYGLAINLMHLNDNASRAILSRDNGRNIYKFDLNTCDMRAFDENTMHRKFVIIDTSLGQLTIYNINGEYGIGMLEEKSGNIVIFVPEGRIQELLI